MQAMAAQHGPRGGAWKPTKRSRLCSTHLADSCFVNSELTGSDQLLRRRSKRLKADAVPTLFEHTARMVKAAKDSSEGKGLLQ